MSFPIQHLAIILVAMGIFVLIKSVLATLAGRVQMDLDRHRMLIAVKQRRRDYVQSLAHRQGLGSENSSVIIEDH